MTKDSKTIDPWTDEPVEVFQEAKIVKARNDDGNIIIIQMVDNIPHSLDDRPSYELLDNLTGNPIHRAWHNGGKLQRDNGGPTSITYSPSGRLLGRAFHENGKPRSHGPTSEEFDEMTGVKIYVEYRPKSILYRCDGPAEIFIDPLTEVATSERWYTKLGLGKVHRDDHAAHIERDRETGVTTLRIWVQHGYLWRPGGQPPVVTYDRLTGEIAETKWASRNYPASAPGFYSSKPTVIR